MKKKPTSTNVFRPQKLNRGPSCSRSGIKLLVNKGLPVPCRWAHLHWNGVRQPLDGHRVQPPVGQAPHAAPQHVGLSAAVQLVSHLQLFWTQSWKMKLVSVWMKTSLFLFSHISTCVCGGLFSPERRTRVISIRVNEALHAKRISR